MDDQLHLNCPLYTSCFSLMSLSIPYEFLMHQSVRFVSPVISSPYTVVLEKEDQISGSPFVASLTLLTFDSVTLLFERLHFRLFL